MAMPQLRVARRMTTPQTSPGPQASTDNGYIAFYGGARHAAMVAPGMLRCAQARPAWRLAFSFACHPGARRRRSKGGIMALPRAVL